MRPNRLDRAPKTLAMLLLAMVLQGTVSALVAQLYPVRIEGRWGLIDGKGKLVAPANYDAVQPVPDGYALVVQAGRFGLLDPDGATVIPPRYTFIQRISTNLWALNQGGDCAKGDCHGGKWGLAYLPLARFLEPRFDHIADFGERAFAIANLGGTNTTGTYKGGKWALLDTTASILLQPEYDAINPVSNAFALVKNNGGWGLYDLPHQAQVIPSIYDDLHFITTNWLSARKGDRASLIDTDGVQRIQGPYREFRDAGEGLLSHLIGDHWGLMDSTGRERIPAHYDRVLAKPNNWVELRLADNIALARHDGKILGGPSYREAGAYGKGYTTVAQGLAWGVVDSTGKKIVPIQYEDIRIAFDTLFIVRYRKVMRWIGIDGKTRRGIAFEHFGPFENNLAKVTVGTRVGLVNQFGEWLVPPRYDEVNTLLTVAQARVKGGQWEYFYFDDLGRKSTTKRLVIMRADGEQVGDGNDLIEQGGGNVVAEFGWFIGGDQLWGLRNRQGTVLIKPKYRSVEPIPGTNLTIVEAKIGNTEDFGYGIVNHAQGKQTVEPMFQRVIAEDFRLGSACRAIYKGNGRYTLIKRNGVNVLLNDVTYIRPFSEGMAAACVGGGTIERAEPRFDTLRQFTRENPSTRESEKVYVYGVGGKWGYVDTTGRWIAPPAYEQALSFSGARARIKAGGKWGLVAPDLSPVLAPAYDFIEPLYGSGSDQLYTVGTERARYGFIDTSGTVVVEPQFLEAGTYHEGMARVKVDGLWGFADMEGNLVVPPRYKEVGDFHQGRARVRNLRKWGYIDMQGNAVTPEAYLRAGDFHDGRAWVQVAGLYGYLDRDGQLAIPATFTKAADFEGGVAPVQEKGGTGLIDHTGRFCIPPRYYRVIPSGDSLAVVQQGGSYGLAKLSGEVLVKPKYKAIGAYAEGLAPCRSGFEFGYIDIAGIERIPPAFANAGPFSCKRAPVFSNGRWGFINDYGTVVVEPQYTSVGPYREGRAAVRMGQKWGYIDLEGKLVVPAIYDRATPFENGRAAVYLAGGNGWGFVNTDGTRVVPCMYDKVGSFQNGIVPVCLDRKWGVLNQYGALVTLMKYDEIRNYDNGLAQVLVNRTVGVADAKGRVVIGPEFDSVKPVRGLIQAERNDRMGYLGLDGQWVWQPSK